MESSGYSKRKRPTYDPIEQRVLTEVMRGPLDQFSTAMETDMTYMALQQAAYERGQAAAVVRRAATVRFRRMLRIATSLIAVVGIAAAVAMGYPWACVYVFLGAACFYPVAFCVRTLNVQPHHEVIRYNAKEAYAADHPVHDVCRSGNCPVCHERANPSLYSFDRWGKMTVLERRYFTRRFPALLALQQERAEYVRWVEATLHAREDVPPEEWKALEARIRRRMTDLEQRITDALDAYEAYLRKAVDFAQRHGDHQKRLAAVREAVNRATGEDRAILESTALAALEAADRRFMEELMALEAVADDVVLGSFRLDNVHC
jgi:hypothetical protein